MIEQGRESDYTPETKAMREIRTERDFLHWFLGVLTHSELSSTLAQSALTCWRASGAPREGTAAEVGRILAAWGELDVDPRSGERATATDKLHELVKARIKATAPAAVAEVIEQKLAQHESRLLDGAPTLESDLRELERLLKMSQLRGYIMLHGLGLPELTREMLRRMSQEQAETWTHREDAGDVDIAVARDEIEMLSTYRDRAYQERNQLACIVARLVLDAGGRAGTYQDEHGELGFKTVVAFDLPTGQATFHMDERDARAPWERLPAYPHAWDEHTDEVKWDRLAAFLASPFLPETPAQARWLREALIASGEAKPAELLGWLRADVDVALGVARRAELDGTGKIKDIRKQLETVAGAVTRLEP